MKWFRKRSSYKAMQLAGSKMYTPKRKLNEWELKRAADLVQASSENYGLDFLISHSYFLNFYKVKK